MKLLTLILLFALMQANQSINSDEYQSLYQKTINQYHKEMEQYSSHELEILNAEYAKALQKFDQHQKEFENLVAGAAFEEQIQRRMKKKDYSDDNEAKIDENEVKP